MFVDFIYQLREHKIPVGAQEAVALANALSKGLHQSSLDGFYHVARALLIHNESHLDDFDVVFAAHFRGVYLEAKKVTEELLEWLKDPKTMRELTPEEREAMEELNLEELLEQFEQRLKEQKGRHDGGNRWIGTGGTSPFGRGGFHKSGLSVGQSGGGGGGRAGAIGLADARRYRPYRSDVVLDVRQIEVALRKLRAFKREGTIQELDIDGTIDATAKNAGELEIITRPPRRPNTRVILMMDVGGSMDPYARLASQLFSAAKRATHWKELRTYYFHNCVYGRVFKTEGFLDPVTINDLMAECNNQYKLVLVGDACMAPYELLGSSGWGDEARIAGVSWLQTLKDHFHRAVWLNPEGDTMSGHPTVEAIGQIFPMFPLTVDGLGEAIGELIRGGKR